MFPALGSFTGIQVRDRDVQLLRGLFESRVMTLMHAANLHFDGKREATKKRVQKLKSAGLIRERPRRAYEPSVLHLTAAGIQVLRARDVLTDYPHLSGSQLQKRARVSDATLRHELQVMDVK